MAALDRWELLVNNELFADVVFCVGSEGTLMYGHKAVLTVASDVFRAQFTGNFKESRENGQEYEILVIDIEPPVFKEILRYAYCDRVTITVDNVLHLLYAAEKYLLAKLTQECTEFVEQHLSEENALQIFVQNRNYELEDINRKCLDMISANPIRMFGDEHFVTLDSKSLKMIAECKRMNCQLNHLTGAIETWMKINEHDAERGNEIFSIVQSRMQLDHMCNYLYNFSKGFYQANIATAMQINADKPFYIHGIGVALKSRCSTIEPKTIRLDVSVTQNGDDSTNKGIVRSLSVHVNEVERVVNIMFERQKVDRRHGLYIIIAIDNKNWPMYAMDGFSPDQPDVGLYFGRGFMRANCVQYILYTEKALLEGQLSKAEKNTTYCDTDTVYVYATQIQNKNGDRFWELGNG